MFQITDSDATVVFNSRNVDAIQLEPETYTIIVDMANVSHESQYTFNYPTLAEAQAAFKNAVADWKATMPMR